jgi:hypothetical protein
MRYEFHPEAEQELYEAASRYEAEVPELGLRFADEVEALFTCCWSIQNSVRDWMTNCATSFSGGFRSQSSTRLQRISSTSSLLLTEAASLVTGGCAFKTASKSFPPSCKGGRQTSDLRVKHQW